VPNCRYHVPVKEVKPGLKEMLVELCNWLDITIIGDATSATVGLAQGMVSRKTLFVSADPIRKCLLILLCILPN